MADIIIIIVLVASLTCFVSVIFAFLYVRWFTVKVVEEKIDSIQIQIPMGSEDRIGIEPVNNVIVQQTQNQTHDSFRTAASESSYFVSYFGLCFQPEGNTKMIDKKNDNKKAKKDDNDEESKYKMPFQSIDFFQQQNDDRSQTPPTDEEDSDPSSTNHSDDSCDNNDDTGISISSKDDGNSIDQEDDLSFKIDDRKMSVSQHETSNSDSNEDNDYHDDSDAFGALQAYTQSDFDEDMDMEYSNNSGSALLEQKHRKQDQNYHSPLTSEADGIPTSSNTKDAVQFVDNISDTCNDCKKNSFTRKKTVRIDDGASTIIGSEENPTYFSSDDEQDNQNDDDEEYDNDDFYGNIQPSIEKLYMVEKIESSLSIPDLGENDTASDSGDWELSSSSASSEGIQSAKVVMISTTKNNNSTNTIYPPREDRNNIINYTSSESGTSLTFCTCPFCHEEYNKEEGIRFSYDERCTHLMCLDCCEGGKFAQCYGECPDPECSARQSSPRRPPRVGHQPQVIMSI